MFCGRRYVLSCYRSLEHKMQLLNAAVDTFDGNIILTVRVKNYLVFFVVIGLILLGSALFTQDIEQSGFYQSNFKKRGCNQTFCIVPSFSQSCTGYCRFIYVSI